MSLIVSLPKRTVLTQILKTHGSTQYDFHFFGHILRPLLHSWCKIEFYHLQLFDKEAFGSSIRSRFTHSWHDKVNFGTKNLFNILLFISWMFLWKTGLFYIATDHFPTHQHQGFLSCSISILLRDQSYSNFQRTLAK